MGAGFDSNVLQVGFFQRDVFAGAATRSTGSPFAEARVGLAGRFRLSDAAFAELSYSGSQRAYAVPSASDYSLQLHRATASVELESPHRFRVGASGNGDLFFTGLSAFRGLQASVRGTAWLALDEGDVWSTRLDASFARKVGLSSEFSYLTGNRVDAMLSQELRFKKVSAMAWYRYRVDRGGTVSQAVALADARTRPWRTSSRSAGRGTPLARRPAGAGQRLRAEPRRRPGVARLSGRELRAGPDDRRNRVRVEPPPASGHALPLRSGGEYPALRVAPALRPV